MTATLFARPLLKTISPDQAEKIGMSALLKRGSALLGEDTPVSVHQVADGVVVEGSEFAVLFRADEGVTLATVGEASADDYEEPDEEDEPEDDGEAEEPEDSEDDAEDGEEDDEEEPDAEDEADEADSSPGIYSSIAAAIADVEIPRKLKVMAAEALAARFDELPGAFNHGKFVRAAIATAEGEEEDGVEEAAPESFTVYANGKLVYSGPDDDKAHKAHTDAALRRMYTEKFKGGTLVSYSGTKPKGYVRESIAEGGANQCPHCEVSEYPHMHSAREIAEMAKLGSGGRFKHLQGQLAKKGASNPGALAAWIGRKKYGKRKFQKLAAQGESLEEAAMMRKHFAMIAQTLAGLDMPLNYKRELVGSIASALQSNSERFNRNRFVKATGLSPSQVSEHNNGMASEMFITYCKDGVQLVSETDERIALVRCNTENHVDSARAINAVEEYAQTLGYQYVDDRPSVDEDSIEEHVLIEMEWDAIDDLRALVALAVESFAGDEFDRFGSTVRSIDEAINDGDFELAETLAEPLLEYKRMGQSARRMRIRSLRIGVPASVKTGKVTRSEHRRQLLKRRRMYRTSAGARSKAKRYAKRYQRFRARLRPVGGRTNESGREIMRPLSDILRESAEVEKQMGLAPGSLTAAITQEHEAVTQKITEARRTDTQRSQDDLIAGRLAHLDKGIADKRKEDKLLSAEVTKTYGKWFDRVQVPMLKLPALSNDIRALLASKADLDVEMPKLVAKYKVESEAQTVEPCVKLYNGMFVLEHTNDKLGRYVSSVCAMPLTLDEVATKIAQASIEEAGDKLGVLAGEVMTYLINRPRSTAEDLQKQFRVSATAASSIMGIAAQALAAGQGDGTYAGHVKAIGDVLAKSDAFESVEGEQRLPFALRFAESSANDGGDVFAKHSTKIALSTLKMHALGARLMGGMNHAQAVRYLTAKAGYSSEKVRGLLKKAGHDDANIDAMFTSAETDESTDEAESSGLEVLVRKALLGYRPKDADEIEANANDVAQRMRKSGHIDVKQVPVVVSIARRMFSVKDEAEKPEYGSKGYQDHSYTCGEVFKSFKDCDLPAGHKGPHKMGGKPKDDEKDEAVDEAVPSWKGADAVYSRAYKVLAAMGGSGHATAPTKRRGKIVASGTASEDMRKLIDALNAGDEEEIKGLLLQYRDRFPAAFESEETAPWVFVSWTDEPVGNARIEHHAVLWKKRATAADIASARKHAAKQNDGRVHFGTAKTTLDEIRAAQAAGKTIGESIDEALIAVRVTAKTGESWTTSINGTLADAKKYFLGQEFNIGSGARDKMVVVSKVEQIEESADGSLDLDEEAGEFHPGDVIVPGESRTRQYLVLAVDRFGAYYTIALSGTEKGSQHSGSRAHEFGRWRKVADAKDVKFTGKTAAKLRQAAAWKIRNAHSSSPAPDFWTEKLDMTQLPPIDTDVAEGLAGHGVYEAGEGETMFQRGDGEPVSVDDVIHVGDRVTIYLPQKWARSEGQTRTGRAVMRGPAGWVLNLGGAHGTPGIATDQNVAKIQRGGKVIYTDESVDEKTVECSYCGKRKEKHSGSDAEPYCYECDKKMEKLRDAQHARYEKLRKQDFEEGGFDETTIAKYEVQQRRGDTPVESHMHTPKLSDAKAKALALSKTDDRNVAYVMDGEKVAAAYYRGKPYDIKSGKTTDEARASEPDDATKADLRRGSEAFHARGSERSKARLGHVQLKPTGSSSAPPEFGDPKNPQTKGKKGDEYAVSYKGNAIGTIRFDGSVWSSADANGKRISSHEGWSLRNAISQLLSGTMGDAWGSAAEGIDEEKLDGVRVTAKGVFAKGLNDGTTYTLQKSAASGGEDTYVFITKTGNRAARFPESDIRRFLRNGESGDHNGLVREDTDEAHDPLDDIPSRPDMGKYAAMERELEDALTNAIFNDTKLGKGFERFTPFAGAIVQAGEQATPDKAQFTVERNALLSAFRSGGVLQHKFQGSKADARTIAKAMMAEAWGGVRESSDVDVATRFIDEADSADDFTGLRKLHYKAPLFTNAAMNRDKAVRMFKVGMTAEEIAKAFPEVFIAKSGKLGQKYDSYYADAKLKETRYTITADATQDVIDQYKKLKREGAKNNAQANEGVELPDGRVFNTSTGQIVEGCKPKMKKRPPEDDEDGDEDASEDSIYTEAEYNAIDEAKRKKMKGYWRTTKKGQRIFIENGKVTKGNPHLLRAVSGKR